MENTPQSTCCACGSCLMPSTYPNAFHEHERKHTKLYGVSKPESTGMGNSKTDQTNAPQKVCHKHNNNNKNCVQPFWNQILFKTILTPGYPSPQHLENSSRYTTRFTSLPGILKQGRGCYRRESRHICLECPPPSPPLLPASVGGAISASSRPNRS